LRFTNPPKKVFFLFCLCLFLPAAVPASLLFFLLLTTEASFLPESLFSSYLWFAFPLLFLNVAGFALLVFFSPVHFCAPFLISQILLLFFPPRADVSQKIVLPSSAVGGSCLTARHFSLFRGLRDFSFEICASEPLLSVSLKGVSPPVSPPARAPLRRVLVSLFHPF